MLDPTKKIYLAYHTPGIRRSFQLQSCYIKSAFSANLVEFSVNPIFMQHSTA